MPRFIIKPKRDVDFYVDWSEIVDAPCVWGDRAEMLREGTNPARLDRCDLKGSSCAGDIADWYTWDRDKYRSVIYEQRGALAIDDMQALCDRIAANQNADVSDLLTPFEGDPR